MVLLIIAIILIIIFVLKIAVSSARDPYSAKNMAKKDALNESMSKREYKQAKKYHETYEREKEKILKNRVKYTDAWKSYRK